MKHYSDEVVSALISNLLSRWEAERARALQGYKRYITEHNI
jgi:hypothetical protein